MSNRFLKQADLDRRALQQYAAGETAKERLKYNLPVQVGLNMGAGTATGMAAYALAGGARGKGRYVAGPAAIAGTLLSMPVTYNLGRKIMKPLADPAAKKKRDAIYADPHTGIDDMRAGEPRKKWEKQKVDDEIAFSKKRLQTPSHQRGKVLPAFKAQQKDARGKKPSRFKKEAAEAYNPEGIYAVNDGRALRRDLMYGYVNARSSARTAPVTHAALGTLGGVGVGMGLVQGLKHVKNPKAKAALNLGTLAAPFVGLAAGGIHGVKKAPEIAEKKFNKARDKAYSRHATLLGIPEGSNREERLLSTLDLMKGHVEKHPKAKATTKTMKKEANTYQTPEQAFQAYQKKQKNRHRAQGAAGAVGALAVDRSVKGLANNVFVRSSTKTPVRAISAGTKSLGVRAGGLALGAVAGVKGMQYLQRRADRKRLKHYHTKQAMVTTPLSKIAKFSVPDPNDNRFFQGRINNEERSGLAEAQGMAFEEVREARRVNPQTGEVEYTTTHRYSPSGEMLGKIRAQQVRDAALDQRATLDEGGLRGIMLKDRMAMEHAEAARSGALGLGMLGGAGAGALLGAGVGLLSRGRIKPGMGAAVGGVVGGAGGTYMGHRKSKDYIPDTKATYSPLVQAERQKLKGPTAELTKEQADKINAERARNGQPPMSRPSAEEEANYWKARARQIQEGHEKTAMIKHAWSLDLFNKIALEEHELEPFRNHKYDPYEAEAEKEQAAVEAELQGSQTEEAPEEEGAEQEAPEQEVSPEEAAAAEEQAAAEEAAAAAPPAPQAPSAADEIAAPLASAIAQKVKDQVKAELTGDLMAPPAAPAAPAAPAPPPPGVSAETEVPAEEGVPAEVEEAPAESEEGNIPEGLEEELESAPEGEEKAPPKEKEEGDDEKEKK
jgi:hypothetical protein